MKDYYAILGVVSSAEDVVIRAAYKALTLRYHPDRYSGDPSRMVEINEAYNVLSDTEKRKVYDKSRGNSQGDFGDWVHEEEADDTSYSFDPQEKDWALAVKYYPDLIEINNRLTKISHLLAFTYRAGLLDQKAFETRKEMALAVETRFLKTYFGDTPEIVNFARELIFGGSKAAAKALNESVRVLGSNSPAGLIINTICKDFNVESAKRKEQRLQKDAQERMRASRASEEEDMMKKFGITCDGESYHFQNFKYNRLSDAINYAKHYDPEHDFHVPPVSGKPIVVIYAVFIFIVLIVLIGH